MLRRPVPSGVEDHGASGHNRLRTSSQPRKDRASWRGYSFSCMSWGLPGPIAGCWGESTFFHPEVYWLDLPTMQIVLRPALLPADTIYTPI